jgi:phosphohistidine phosphatase
MKSAAAVHRLMLLRHGKAMRSRPGESDFERTLDPQGRADAVKLGGYLLRHGLFPGKILVSPARRARETWEAAASVCSRAPQPIHDPRLYDAKAENILALLNELDGSPSSILVVGHNPGLHDLAMLLIASGDVETRERLHEGLPTSGLVIIDFAVDSWRRVHPQSGRLELFVEPETLDAAVE